MSIHIIGLPLRQKEILLAAQKIAQRGIAVKSDSLTFEIERVKPEHDAYKEAYDRTMSVVKTLKKNDIWPYDENGYTIKLKDAQLEYPPGNPVFRGQIKTQVVPAPVLPSCNLPEPTDNESHDFGRKILEEYEKLTRAAQKKFWPHVKSIGDIAFDFE